MKYVVVGAGAMGRISVKDLMEFVSPSDTIIVADYDGQRAKELTQSLKDVRLKPIQLDVRNHTKSVEDLRGSNVLINAIQYQMNLEVMRICLAAKIHYVDMGGLFHMTKKQQQLHEEFKKEKLIAVLGMGAAPGITNLLARLGADQMDSVSEIHTRVAGVDRTKYKSRPALMIAYSLKTILEEFSLKPAVFTKGQLEFREPMTGNNVHQFPAPVGKKRPMYTLHSEVATLPESYRHKGVKEVSFKIAFDEEFLDRVQFLRDLGCASAAPVDIAGISVSPIDLINKVAMSQSPAVQVGPSKQYEIVRAIVKGKIQGKKVTIISDCHTKGLPEWGFGVDVDTGCPPSIVAQMIAGKLITTPGVHAPELIVPAKEFFKELKKRKMVLKVQKRSGWNFSA